MSGKGGNRRKGANDAAFKAAPWPPDSPLLQKLNVPRSTINKCDTCKTPDTYAHCECGKVTAQNTEA